MAQWFIEHWFEIVTSVCGIGGLWFSAFSIRKNAQAQAEEAKARRISNLLAITANHREVWKDFHRSPALARVIDPAADVIKQPVTPAEEFFMNTIISNTLSVYEALKDELVTKQEGLRRDVKSFFSLPVPKAVWIKTKLLQNQDFAAFIESSLK
jgi:hypothetical protein